MTVTGAAVVVVVGVADDVGRTGTTGETVDWFVDVEDVREGELVTVEVVDVVAVEVEVEVEVDVRGTAEVLLDVVVVELDVEDLDELVGDWVTVC